MGHEAGAESVGAFLLVPHAFGDKGKDQCVKTYSFLFRQGNKTGMQGFRQTRNEFSGCLYQFRGFCDRFRYRSAHVRGRGNPCDKSVPAVGEAKRNGLEDGKREMW
jgi:hypothetical protein